MGRPSSGTAGACTWTDAAAVVGVVGEAAATDEAVLDEGTGGATSFVLLEVLAADDVVVAAEVVVASEVVVSSEVVVTSELVVVASEVVVSSEVVVTSELVVVLLPSHVCDRLNLLGSGAAGVTSADEPALIKSVSDLPAGTAMNTLSC